MVSLTPDMLGNTFVVLIITYVITLGYSIYMAYLNYKQAKMKGILEETNRLLNEIKTILEKK